MTESDLIREVARHTGLKQDDVKRTIRGVSTHIGTILSDGDKVQIQGVGTFSTKVRAARQRRDFKTGNTFESPERRVVRFTPAKGLKESVATAKPVA